MAFIECDAFVFSSFLFYFTVFYRAVVIMLWPHCPVHKWLLTTVVLYLLIAANDD